MGPGTESTLGHLMVWLVGRSGSEVDQPDGLGDSGWRSRDGFFTHNPPFSQRFGIPARLGRTELGSVQRVARLV